MHCNVIIKWCSSVMLWNAIGFRVQKKIEHFNDGIAELAILQWNLNFTFEWKGDSMKFHLFYSARSHEISSGIYSEQTSEAAHWIMTLKDTLKDTTGEKNHISRSQ